MTKISQLVVIISCALCVYLFLGIAVYAVHVIESFHVYVAFVAYALYAFTAIVITAVAVKLCRNCIKKGP